MALSKDNGHEIDMLRFKIRMEHVKSISYKIQTVLNNVYYFLILSKYDILTHALVSVIITDC